MSQVAEDFGISEGTSSNWLKRADIEDGNRPGVTEKQSAEVRELKKRNRLLEQENEVLRRTAADLGITASENRVAAVRDRRDLRLPPPAPRQAVPIDTKPQVRAGVTAHRVRTECARDLA